MNNRSGELRAIAKTLLFVAAFLAAAAAHVAAQTTTVILVRHAEKVDDSRDPLLSEAGEARAQELARLLAPRGISAIFTTQYQRTRLTAAPLAARLQLTPTVVEASVSADTLARRIREHSGTTVLVVGHSNTVPVIIRALGGPDIGQIPDAEYDNLYILRLHADGTVEYERTTFGVSRR